MSPAKPRDPRPARREHGPGEARTREARPRPRLPDSRRVALDVLNDVLAPPHRPFDEAFGGHPHLGRLAVRDRAFARLLVTTVLRRLGQIDHAVLPLLRYRPKSIEATNLLRLGAAQILFLQTPAHAAVSETVRLATAGRRREAPMLNAVLRRVAADGRKLLEGQDEVRLDTPRWLYESWAAAYGAATARAIAEAHQHEPPLDLSVKAEPERWAQALGAELLPTGTLRRRSGGLVEALPVYDEGTWWVQDAAAALPALLLGNVKGKRVLDIGAAPGGKTSQLCSMGATVTAIERSPKRAEFLDANLGRLQQTAAIVVADAREWQAPEPFPFVLLDAPCTATGTIRRHPDIPWVKSPDDVTRLAEAQGQLLDAATRLTAPGGTLVYAVCSLQPEEGPQRIEAFLAAGAPFVRSPIARSELKGLEADITAPGEVRTLPCHLAAQGGIDGFFIARLKRKSS